MATSKKSGDYDDQKVVRGLTERERETLPVWAQERLAEARHAKDEAEKKYNDQLDSTEKTTTAYGDVYDNPKYVPDSQYDIFALSMDGSTDVTGGEWVHLRRKVDRPTGATYLEIDSSESLAVVPQASNVVRVYLMDYSEGNVVTPALREAKKEKYRKIAEERKAAEDKKKASRK